MEIGGVKLRSQKAKVDGIREQIALLNESLMHSDVAKTKAEKIKTKLEKAFRSSTKELENVTAEMEELDKEIEEQRNAAELARKRVEEAVEFLETKREEVQEVKTELEGKLEEVNKRRAVEVGCVLVFLCRFKGTDRCGVSRLKLKTSWNNTRRCSVTTKSALHTGRRNSAS